MNSEEQVHFPSTHKTIHQLNAKCIKTSNLLHQSYKVKVGTITDLVGYQFYTHLEIEFFKVKSGMWSNSLFIPFLRIFFNKIVSLVCKVLY